MVDDSLLSILVCPADRGPLLLTSSDDGAELLYNPRLRRAYRIDDGIPVLLVDEARDVDDDEHARLMERARPAAPR
ncbi:Trm112 family protein [Mycobacterium sp. 663a-19]|uniref:Trm112 family protein n=1 Tax=Mycobacterium sp. 663a-19 TaxID=2986148 RepID=UPI002D1ED896|nr:Trm112 family protein [Mycobacterium sp. 663a-19]MEB3981841.1 Trm112 family protein [Mycobacterium sp. 663a-19]